MSLALNPLLWPVRVRIPLVVAGLMIVVSVAMTQVVLSRLIANQEQGLQQLANAYLDGVSTALFPYIERRDVWESYDVLERAAQNYAGLQLRFSIIALPDGSVLAASDPVGYPVDSALPESISQRHATDQFFVINEDEQRAWLHRRISENDYLLGDLYAEADLSSLIKERRDVFWTLVGVNTFLTFLFAGIGYLIAWRMLRPLGVITSFIEQVRHGGTASIPPESMPRKGSEYYDVYIRLNAMIDALHERRLLAQKLADEEKLAMLGKLTSGIAHEVNNPLGGMMNAVDTLKKHGADAGIRDTSVGLLERGLKGIRDVVQAALVTYKVHGKAEALSANHLDDLKFLIHHEVIRRQLRLVWCNEIAAPVDIDAVPVRQATLNILLNACAASRIGGSVELMARCDQDTLRISVTDSGAGMPDEIATLLQQRDPDSLPLQGDSGLGAWLANRLVVRLGGHCSVDVNSKTGSTVTIHLPIMGHSSDQKEDFGAVA